MFWVSEGNLLVKQMTEFIEEVRLLGPLNWPKWNAKEGYYAKMDALEEAA